MVVRVKTVQMPKASYCWIGNDLLLALLVFGDILSQMLLHTFHNFITQFICRCVLSTLVIAIEEICVNIFMFECFYKRSVRYGQSLQKE